MLYAWALSLGAFAGSWTSVPVTWFFAVFLKAVDPVFFAQFVTSNTKPYFVFLLLNPDLRPSDLLKLPRPCKTDVGWGLYMSVFTDEDGVVRYWYTGSATGFGAISSDCRNIRPSGLIGRMLSYFQRRDQTYKHSRFLTGTEGRHLNKNMVKIAEIPEGSEWQVLHRIYTLALEALFIVLLTFNVKRNDPGSARVQGTADWVQEFREKHSISQFPEIEGLNEALPVKQGVQPDKRFTADRRVCSNEHCPAGTDQLPWSRFISAQVGQVWNGEVLCQPCWTYQKDNGVQRPKHVIDKFLLDRAAKAAGARDACYWCFTDLPKVDQRNKPGRGLKPTSEIVRSIHIEGAKFFVCKRCFDDYKFRNRFVALPGVHIPADHVFECQGPSCTKADRSMALRWFCDTTGSLLCEVCYYANKDLNLRIARLRKIRNNPANHLHRLKASDVVHGSIRQDYVLHIKVHLQIDAGDNRIDTDDAALHRKIKAVHDQVDVASLDMDRLAEWLELDKVPTATAATSAILDDDDDGDTTLLASTIGNDSTLVNLDDVDSDEPINTAFLRKGKNKGTSKGKGKGKAIAVDESSEIDSDVPMTRSIPSKAKARTMNADDSDDEQVVAGPAIKRRRLARSTRPVANTTVELSDDDNAVASSSATPAQASSSRPRRSAAPAKGALKLDYIVDDEEDSDFA